MAKSRCGCGVRLSALCRLLRTARRRSWCLRSSLSMRSSAGGGVPGIGIIYCLFTIAIGIGQGCDSDAIWQRIAVLTRRPHRNFLGRKLYLRNNSFDWHGTRWKKKMMQRRFVSNALLVPYKIYRTLQSFGHFRTKYYAQIIQDSRR